MATELTIEEPLPRLTQLAANAEQARALRLRSLANLFSMGHCAPSIMQTALDVSDNVAPWLVRLTAGLPGGIGNTGFECGGVTSPLLLLGLHHGLDEQLQGLPLVFRKAHAYLQRFEQAEHSSLCRDIRGGARLPLVCIGVVRRAGPRLAATLREPAGASFDPEREAAYARLYACFAAARFHCAQAVFEGLALPPTTLAALSRAGAAFMGGIAFSGRTCCALTAGVMALGLAQGRIERSTPRVLHMLGLMAVGGDAFADDVNAFNASMNRAHDLARWFETQFGSTQCRALTRCDFATADGANAYIEHGGLDTCQALTAKLTAHVRALLNDPSTRSGP